MFEHDDITGETIAELWHKIAEVISIVAAISGAGIVVTATAGTIWHRWAANQHKEKIKELKERLYE